MAVNFCQRISVRHRIRVFYTHASGILLDVGAKNSVLISLEFEVVSKCTALPLQLINENK